MSSTLMLFQEMYDYRKFTGITPKIWLSYPQTLSSSFIIPVSFLFRNYLGVT